MTRHLRASALAVLSLAAFATGLSAQDNRSRADAASNLRADMRKLWEDHVHWTRNYIISAVANLPDRDTVTARLLRNQADIGNAIKPFYGDSAGDKLTALLRGHIMTAAELVIQAKGGDESRVRSASERWNANADSIAVFLSAANPRNWSERTLKAEMRRHLELTTAEVQARLRGDWSADVRAYDEVHDHIVHFADLLAEGITRQFPDRVARR